MRDLELILDAIDEELVDHVDAHGLLALGTAERMLGYAEALEAGRISFQQLDEEWEQWHPLVVGFIEAFGCDDLADMMELVPFGGEDLARPLTHADQAFLQALIDELTIYVDERRAGTTDF